MVVKSLLSKVSINMALFLALSAVVASQEIVDELAPAEKRPLFGFVPLAWPAILAAALYAASLLAHLSWFFFGRIRRRPRYMICLLLGMGFMSIGYILRLVYRVDPGSVLKYSVTTLFILLSPCLFLATQYLLLEHVANSLGSPEEDIGSHCLFISSKRIVKIFVWADVATFLVQAGGGGLSANDSTAQTGSYIALVGLSLQSVTYLLFMTLLIVFGLRVRKYYPEAWDPAQSSSQNSTGISKPRHWRTLFHLMLLASVGIMVRSIFRLVEYAQGHNGYLITHEGYFYLLDGLPLWLAMTLYAIYWPANYIRSGRNSAPYTNSSRESESKLYGNEMRQRDQNFAENQDHHEHQHQYGYQKS